MLQVSKVSRYHVCLKSAELYNPIIISEPKVDKRSSATIVADESSSRTTRSNLTEMLSQSAKDTKETKDGASVNVTTMKSPDTSVL